MSGLGKESIYLTAGKLQYNDVKPLAKPLL